ncbi:Xanthine dehydrogenase [Caligus rogercresseyi]|uniref:Xanthine dehydrogenase n=1 Tax=Caligus rogercresseyi TaxID=217165 RepID=A0A7T8HIV0_CALRO|nr:Xanthine dehydrogenase [Caligus rogercresseyi]
MTFKSEKMTWIRISSLEELLDLKDGHPKSKIVIGNTELGIEMKFGKFSYPLMIDPTNVRIKFYRHSHWIRLNFRGHHDHLKKIIEEEADWKTRIFKEIVEMLKWFASKQIRNVGSIVGNIMTGSPISDLNPILLAAGCVLTLQSKVGGLRRVILDENFYTSYRKNIVGESEILTSVLIPFTQRNEYFAAYKQARRRDDDIAITWSRKTMEEVFPAILSEVNLRPGAPGGMEEYRQTLLICFLYKAFLKISDEKSQNIDATELSATKYFSKPFYTSKQIYDIPKGNVEFNPVGKPVKHASSEKQASGEAIYIDDMPEFKNQVYASFVLSKKANAKILRIDSSTCSSDAAQNSFQVTSIEDEVMFADGFVHHVGQIIGMVIGITVEYEEYESILTIEEALKHKSFYGLSRKIVKGDVEKAFKECDHIIEGDSSTGAQEHFYLEPNVGIATHEEEGEIKLYTTTQNPTETQACVAYVLGLPMSKIHCVVKRLGGGFGGKETRNIPLSVAAAFAAYKLKRPVKFILERDEDMMLTGHRHPSFIKYKVGFLKTGRIKALDLELYLNAGFTLDLSVGVLDRAFLHVDNAYKFENFRGKGFCCKTNIASNTAFRGFGSPQGMMAAEMLIEAISHKLSMDAVKRSDYYNELECIKAFNAKNKWKKRGISIIPTKFGVCFGLVHLNQGGCLIHIYTDGSVLITSGGVEMGQGLHTKAIQIASQMLGVPTERVTIIETSTDKVPNSSPTAASLGSDLYGMAVLNACDKLNKRLEPVKKANKDCSWTELVRRAYLDRVCLSATGFYKVPNINMDWKSGVGSPYSYFTCGVACSITELDVLTGDHSILKTKIVMDLGESLNPAIDVGQIEGAFMQGYGLYVMEQVLHSPGGALITKGPSNYKIPSCGDIPSDFEVSLLRGSSNPRAVFSSKAVGEPPLFLASSVYFALREAIRSYREDRGLYDFFKLDVPATPERIRMLCSDEFTALITPLGQNEKNKWSLQA